MHCKDLDLYGEGNLGVDGIEAFLVAFLLPQNAMSWFISLRSLPPPGHKNLTWQNVVLWVLRVCTRP